MEGLKAKDGLESRRAGATRKVQLSFRKPGQQCLRRSSVLNTSFHFSRHALRAEPKTCRATSLVASSIEGNRNWVPANCRFWRSPPPPSPSSPTSIDGKWLASHFGKASRPAYCHARSEYHLRPCNYGSRFLRLPQLTSSMHSTAVSDSSLPQSRHLSHNLLLLLYHHCPSPTVPSSSSLSC